MNSRAERERHQVVRRLVNFLQWSAETPSEPGPEDLATIAEPYRDLVREEVGKLREQWRRGDRVGVRRRAAEAANLLWQAYGAAAVSASSDPLADASPREIAAAVYGEAPPPATPSEPRLRGGGDPTEPPEPVDPREIARRVPRR